MLHPPDRAEAFEQACDDLLGRIETCHQQGELIVASVLIEDLVEVVEAAESSPAPTLLRRIIEQVASTSNYCGEYERGRVLCRRIQTIVGDSSALDVLVATAALYRDEGKLEAAKACLQQAMVHPQIATDADLRLRIANNRGVLNLDLGDFEQASDDFELALQTAVDLGSHYAIASLQHNQAVALTRMGRPQEALNLFERATQEFTRLDRPYAMLESLVDRVELLLSVGLGVEAQDAATLSFEAHSRYGSETSRLDALRLQIRVAMFNGDWHLAKMHAFAGAAMASADSGSDEQLLAQAELFSLLADEDTAIERSVVERAGLAAPLTRQAILLRLIRLGHSEDAASLVRSLPAATGGTEPGVIERLTSYLISALIASDDGDWDRCIAQTESGLLDAEANQVMLASSELRKFALLRVGELLSVAVDAAYAHGNPDVIRDLADRGRHVTLSPEPDLSADELRILEQLGRLGSGLEDNTARAELEHAFRRQRHRQTPNINPSSNPTNIASRSSQSRWFIARGRTDVFAAIATDGELKMLRIGPADELIQKVRSLNLLADCVGGGVLDPASTEAVVASVCALLRPLFDSTPPGPVIVQLGANLPVIPWALLMNNPVSYGSFTPTTVAISPAELQSRRLHLIEGPDLAYAKDEGRAIMDVWQNSSSLSGSAATTAAVRQLVDEADMLHVSAHGRFRSDNPLFSEIQLHDGQFTFCDLLRSDRAPLHVAFASCEVGRNSASSAVGAFGVLQHRGCSVMLAGVGRIRDKSMTELMSAYYSALAAGTSPSVALRTAQTPLLENDPSVGLMLCFGETLLS